MKKIESDNNNNLRIISGSNAEKLLIGKEEKIIRLIRDTYILHQKGNSSLPHSIFLRFPSKSQDRIIGLPAYINETAGIKWIASFLDNITKGMDRASATIILNSLSTGRPYAILEGSIISAKRTAASAALAAKILSKNKENIRNIGFVGCGFINFEILRFIISQFRSLELINLFDLDYERARLFAERATTISGIKIKINDKIDDLLLTSKIISFATTASAPHVVDSSLIQRGSIVLHISLRDLCPDVIKKSFNIVDDIEHVNRENTSIHLASNAYGNTNFVTASLGELLLGQKNIPNESSRPVIFSPFGLGILDIQLARFVYEQAVKENTGILVEDFIPPSWHRRS